MNYVRRAPPCSFAYEIIIDLGAQKSRSLNANAMLFSIVSAFRADCSTMYAITASSSVPVSSTITLGKIEKIYQPTGEDLLIQIHEGNVKLK